MFLRATLLAGVIVVAIPSASSAEHVCYDVEVPGGPGEMVVIEVCPGHGGPDVPPPSDGELPGDGDVDRPADPVRYGGPPVTCDETEPVPNYGPGWVAPELREDGSLWVRYYFDCTDGTTEIREVCVAGCSVADLDDPGPPAVARFRSVPDLRLEALARVDPPLPEMRHSFDQVAESGEVRAVVLAEQWWWMEAPLEPITVRAEDGPVWVEVTATPGEMTIDPGDDTGELSCEAPGVAYNLNVSYYDQVPGEPKGACVHVYEQTSEAMTASMSMIWEITWKGETPTSGPMLGTLAPIVRMETTTFPVREIQSVITASGS